MSDLIDREKFIYTLIFSEKTKSIFVKDLRSVIEVANEMPSAELEWKWISVRDKLPKEEKKSYWICTDTEYQCECRWTNNIYGIGESNEWGWSIFDIPQYTKVIAWIPLPEPYRGK